MKTLYMYYGTVTNINDPEVKGRIQVKVLPEFKDMKEADLPYFKPYFNKGMSASTQSLDLPNVGDKIYVYIDIHFRIFYYITGAFIEGLFDYASIKSSLGAISELSNKEYPNINFELTTDGSISFHNRISGDSGFLHSTGTYWIINANGYIYLSEKSGNKITINNSGIVLEDKNGNDITMGSSSVIINGNFEVLQSV